MFFWKSEIEYLGHIIFGERVATDPAKIKVMSRWPVPQSLKEQLRSFLGLTCYYRKFVHYYGVICRPLTDLFKKDPFQWGEILRAAFEASRTAMTQALVLALPDFNRPFIVEMDACNMGMGAVLQRNGHPIAYIFKAFGEKGQGLSVYEKELLAITFAVTKWRHYLEESLFYIKTDHEYQTFTRATAAHQPSNERHFQVVWSKL